MKGFIRLLALITALTAVFIILPAGANASGVSVSADVLEADPGDTVTVTVSLTGTALGAAQGTFTYDPAVLTFVSASGGASDGFIDMVSAEKGGSDSLVVTVKFTAAAGGESVINVDISRVLSYDGGELSGGEGAVKITVKGTAQEPPEDTPAVDITAVCIPAKNVSGGVTDTQMYVWRTLEERTLPSRYADCQVEYSGEFIGGAAIPDTDFPILLYLTDALGENGGYYVYEAERDILYPYETVSSPSASYTVILPPEGVLPPEGWTQTEIDDDGDIFQGWTAAAQGVYLIYARNSAGENGFFMYDMVGGSVQRYIETTEPEPEPTPEAVNTPEPVQTAADTVTVPLFAVYGAIGAAAIMLVLIIVLAARGAANGGKGRKHKERKTTGNKRADTDGGAKEPGADM